MTYSKDSGAGKVLLTPPSCTNAPFPPTDGTDRALLLPGRLPRPLNCSQLLAAEKESIHHEGPERRDSAARLLQPSGNEGAAHLSPAVQAQPGQQGDGEACKATSHTEVWGSHSGLYTSQLKLYARVWPIKHTPYICFRY